MLHMKVRKMLNTCMLEMLQNPAIAKKNYHPTTELAGFKYKKKEKDNHSAYLSLFFFQHVSVDQFIYFLMENGLQVVGFSRAPNALHQRNRIMAVGSRCFFWSDNPFFTRGQLDLSGQARGQDFFDFRGTGLDDCLSVFPSCT